MAMASRLGTLHAVLASRGVRVLVPTALAGPGSRWFEIVKDTIHDADWVVAVPSEAGDNEMVFFELGLATAVGKRCVIVAEPELPLPLAFESLFVLRTAPENKMALEFGFDRLLSAKHQKKTKRKRSTQRYVLGADADRYISELQSIAPRDFIALERLVHAALQHAGVNAIAGEFAAADTGYDIAAWVDELEPYVGNPLPIEVKYVVRDATMLRKLNRLALHRWALLVYVEGPGPESDLWRSLASTILHIGVRDLLNRMRDESFVEIVRDLRNRVAHGTAG